MDDAFRRALAEAIRDLDSGATLDTVLRTHPDYADRMREHLVLWHRLESTQRPAVAPAHMTGNRQAMLGALAMAAHSRTFPVMSSALARATVAVAGVILLLGSAAGASAGLGGPDVAGDALNVVGVTHDNENDLPDGCLTATPGAPPVANSAFGANSTCEEQHDGDNDECDDRGAGSQETACAQEADNDRGDADDADDACPAGVAGCGDEAEDEAEVPDDDEGLDVEEDENDNADDSGDQSSDPVEAPENEDEDGQGELPESEDPDQDRDFDQGSSGD